MAALISCSLPASATQPDSQPVSQPSLTAASASQLHSASYGQPANQQPMPASYSLHLPPTASKRANQPAVPASCSLSHSQPAAACLIVSHSQPASQPPSQPAGEF